MNSPEWHELYGMIRSVARRQPKPKRRFTFSDELIVAMHFWHVAHDRPQCWACERANYRRPFLPRRLPSVAQFNRRVRSDRCQTIIHILDERLRGQADALCYLDGRPLPVGPCTKDAEAKAGRVYGGFARGYRLHACMNASGEYVAWQITGLNASEKPVARNLVKEARPRGLALGDGNYDVHYLYDDVAAFGGQFLAPPRCTPSKGERRRQYPNRRIAIYLWEGNQRWIRSERKNIDRFFGHHASYGGGLTHLPPWVRTRRRVVDWVRVKIILYHLRLRARKTASA